MFDIYTPESRSPGRPRKSLPSRNTAELWDPKGYLPSANLKQAVNIALLLNQPLLVSGEPGTGKTLLGYSVAWDLGLDPPLVFAAKSDTTARDLYYRFDTLARFHDAQLASLRTKAADYVALAAIGAALVATLPPQNLPAGIGSAAQEPRRSVVIIDEIDKAPRDVPNDILRELETMSFAIPEVGVMIAGNPEFLPVVIFTSNSERSLPDAFLRRCVYHYIPFPSIDELRAIVMARTTLFSTGRSLLLDEMLSVFFSIRSNTTAMRKRPATAELLDWVHVVLAAGAVSGNSLFETRNWVELCVATLSKTAEDQYTLRSVLMSERNGGKF